MNFDEKKQPRKPDRQIDAFIKEIDLLKRDSDKLEKSKASRPKPEESLPVDAENAAKIAAAHLRVSPTFYDGKKGKRQIPYETAKKLAASNKITDVGKFKNAIEVELGEQPPPKGQDKKDVAKTDIPKKAEGQERTLQRDD